ncbi:MAG TPA: prolyl oligopeptidase family serine peptidase [Usitatibacter sp.]|nr:prolyl oligopeptidase family serine peptidase [Usitatibacter sp.]
MKARVFAAAVLAALSSLALAQPAEDPYRELEDASLPGTQAFFREQGERTRAALDALPGRAALLQRIEAFSATTTTLTALEVANSNRVFYLKRAPGQPAALLCMREKISAPERVLVDPARYARAGAPASIEWLSASPDGRHVAYGVSGGAGTDTVLHVVAVDGGELPVAIDRTRLAGDLAWHPDGHSFFYARAANTGAPGKRYANMRVYRHLLGRDAASDEVVFASGVGGARDVPEFVYPSIYIPFDSRHAYAIARDGLRREIAVHVTDLRELAAGKPHWRKIVGYDDDILAIEGWKDDLFLLSHKGAGRHRILRMKGDGDFKAARVAVPEGDSVIEAMALARDALYLRTMVGGIDRLERVGIGFLGGLHAPEYVRTPFDTSISQIVAHPRDTGVLLRLQGWIDPPAVVQVDARGETRDTKLIAPSAADYSDMDEVRLYAPAYDGARIPVTLIYKKGTTLTGQHPTLLTAYGAYDVSLKPSFDPTRLAWLERGGVWAVAHVRGGGEYGESWHDAGRGAAKGNTVADLLAVSDYVVRYGFTNPRKLALVGSNAGGIALGGAITRRPELFAAAVGREPMMDMLHYEAMPSGPSNVPEFGSAATPDGVHQLRAISPLHQVRDEMPYPAVLLTAAMNDPDVEPWQPGKMAARLQAATSSGKPVLLRVDSGAGDNARRAENEELADIYSFLLWQLGDPAFQPAAPTVPSPPATPATAAPPAQEPSKQ